MVIASWPFGRKITAGTGPFVVRPSVLLLTRSFPALRAPHGTALTHHAPPRSPSSSVCRLPRCSTRPSAWSPPPACLATRLASLPPTPFIPPLVPLAPCRRGRSLRGTRLPAPSSPHSRRSSDRRPCGAEENGSVVSSEGKSDEAPRVDETRKRTVTLASFIHSLRSVSLLVSSHPLRAHRSVPSRPLRG